MVDEASPLSVVCKVKIAEGVDTLDLFHLSARFLEGCLHKVPKVYTRDSPNPAFERGAYTLQKYH